MFSLRDYGYLQLMNAILFGRYLFLRNNKIVVFIVVAITFRRGSNVC